MTQPLCKGISTGSAQISVGLLILGFEAITARLVARVDWSCSKHNEAPKMVVRACCLGEIGCQGGDWSCSQHNETPKMVVRACCNANGINVQQRNLFAKESPPDRLKSPWDCSVWVLKQSRRDWSPGWIGVVPNAMRPPKCLSELVAMQMASPRRDTTSLQRNLHRICSNLRGIAHFGF